MAERQGDDERVLQRERVPVPGKRKPPSEDRQQLPPKAGAEEPGHGDVSSSLFAALKDVRFPASRREVLDAAGNRVIALPDGRTIRLSTVVEKAPRAEYGSARELVSEANAMWDDVNRAAHGE